MPGMKARLSIVLLRRADTCAARSLPRYISGSGMQIVFRLLGNEKSRHASVLFGDAIDSCSDARHDLLDRVKWSLARLADACIQCFAIALEPGVPICVREL